MAKKSIYKNEAGKNQILEFYNNLLGSWPQPSVRHTVETTQGETFILESGSKDATPVILLHGSGTNSAMWISDAILLSRKYRVFSIDIIGECGFSSESRPQFKEDHYSAWLNDICMALELETVFIISCSLGGWIALDFAIKYPVRVRKLVLLATAGISPIKASALFWIIITSISGTRGFRMLNKKIYGGIGIDKQALEFASLVKEHYQPRTDALPAFPEEQLKKITAATLFIGGESDFFYNSTATAKRLKENLADAQCIVLPGTGHVLINQTVRILQFLEQ